MVAARFEAANGRRQTFFLRLQGSTANWYGQNVTSHITPQKFMTGGRAICRATPMSRPSRLMIRSGSNRRQDRHAALAAQRSLGQTAFASADRRGAIPGRACLPGRLGEGRARSAGGRSRQGICRWRAVSRADHGRPAQGRAAPQPRRALTRCRWLGVGA